MAVSDDLVQSLIRDGFAAVNQALARLDAKLDTKADKADLAAVNTRLEQIDARVDKLEDDRTVELVRHEMEASHRAARKDWHRWVWPVVLTALWVLFGVLSFFGVHP